jgi:hypothetical protein
MTTSASKRHDVLYRLPLPLAGEGGVGVLPQTPAFANDDEATKSAGQSPRFSEIPVRPDYSPTAAARSVFSTMRADLPRRLRR